MPDSNAHEIRYEDGTILPSHPSPVFEQFITDLWKCTWRPPSPDLAVAHCRALTPEERLFMFRSAARIEAEIAYLRNNSETVCRVFQETKLAKLGYTTALEMALICVARELEDARLQHHAFPHATPRFAPIPGERPTPPDEATCRTHIVLDCPACPYHFVPEFFEPFDLDQATRSRRAMRACPGCRNRLFVTRHENGQWNIALLVPDRINDSSQ